MHLNQETIGRAECANLLHCSAVKIEELARDGEIPALHFGKDWVFVRADLLDFLATKARADAEERRARHAHHGPVFSCPAAGASATHALAHWTPPPLPATDQGPPSSDPPMLIPASEAAQMLSMGRSTFWREVKLGIVAVRSETPIQCERHEAHRGAA